MSKLKQMKGFTLIELIVVVIIIGVLAAIATVAYNQFVGQSRSAAAVSNAVQLRKAIDAYSAQADQAPTDAMKSILGTTGVSTDYTKALGMLGYAASQNDNVFVDSTTAPTKLLIQSGTHWTELDLGNTNSTPSTLKKDIATPVVTGFKNLAKADGTANSGL